MKESLLLKSMFETQRWEEMLKTATEKKIDSQTIKELCYPENRKELYSLIAEDKYNVFPPHIARIPKDNGKYVEEMDKNGNIIRVPEYREVYVNEARDRIVLALINDCLNELFADMIHPQCRSYQKGTGTQAVVKEISTKVKKLHDSGAYRIGVKSDFSKYFDNVKIEVIDAVFNKVESELEFEYGTEPVINLLRRYYHQDIYFEIDGSVQHKYQGLKQGCAVASWLANVVLYELDESMTNHYHSYYRYSDDCIILKKGLKEKEVIPVINSIIAKYGISLNPDKVETLTSNKWFKFLGFNLKADLITLSASRVKKVRKAIDERSIDIKREKPDFTGKKARKKIINFLYAGEYSWATACLNTINCEPDIQELNKYIMDCIRACDTGKLKIGGLGTVTNLPDKTILRGKGRNVTANKSKTGHIENYLSVKCLQNDLHISRPVFDTVVKSLH